MLRSVLLIGVACGLLLMATLRLGVAETPVAEVPAEMLNAEPQGAVIRVDAGSPAAYVDANGQTWQPDTGFEGGGILDRGPVDIANTSEPRLYQTEHWGITSFAQPVPNGTYSVNLFFAETYPGVNNPGERVFDVRVGDTLFAGLDVLAETGGKYRALKKSATEVVTDGVLRVTFTPHQQETMINAIEVFAIDVPVVASGVPATDTSTADPTAVCGTSLQSLINNAEPGSVLLVPPCIYRETITIDKPLTLDGQGRAEIRGSTVWTQWSQSGQYWTHGGLPPFTRSGQCTDGTTRCQWPEQVYVDGRPLLQVASSPRSGQFAVDNNRTVILADDPTGHTVEVTVRDRWVVTASDNVTIQRMTFRHAANSAQTGAIGNDDHSAWTLQDSLLTQTSGGIVLVGRGTGNKILRNEISQGGQWGIGGYKGQSLLIQGNVIHDNNTHGFDPDWEAGGVKMVSYQDLTIDGNEVYGNGGPGLWCDIACQGVTVSNNRVHDNTGAGIFFEISDGASIVGNVVWRNVNNNRWNAGIFISTSSNAEVRGNLVAWSPVGINVQSDDRNDKLPQGVIHTSVHDNTIIMGPTSGTALRWSQAHGGVLFNGASNNVGMNNRYWFPGSENGAQRFEWQGGIARIEAFQATPGGRGGGYLSADERAAALQNAGLPQNP